MPRLGAPIVLPGSLPAQPQLTSPGGLVLRSWRPDAAGDVAAVLEAFADPEIQRWGVRNISTADQARVWMTRWTAAWRAETEACWAVLRDDVVVGRAALRRIDLRGGVGEVGYWVLPGARGHGVASAAAAEVARWAFEQVGLHRLELHHSVHNEASCGVARRIGFELEGTLRDGMLHVDGWHDVHLHARATPH